MLTLSFVDSFLAVVDHGGVRDAARAKGLSQAAVSQHIRKLEAEVGATLLHRSHAACTPTRHGRAFLPIARGLVSMAQRARHLLDARVLRVAASSNIGVYYLPRLLGRFRQLQAEAPELEVTVGTNPDLIGRFKDGLFDLILSEWWDDSPHYSTAVWRQEPLVAILPPDHALATGAGASIDLADLARHPLIAGEAGSGTAQLLRSVFGAAPLPAPKLVLGSTEAVKQAVMAGLGVSIVLAGAVQREVNAGQLAALPIAGTPLCKPFHVTVPANLPEDTPGASFMRFICTQGVAHAQPC